MPRTAAALAVVGAMLYAQPARAQGPTERPPGPYVIDLRGVTVGIPQESPFYPTLPSATFVPTRGFGIDAGAHVYLFQFGAARLGIGLNLVQVRATAHTATSGSVDGDADDDEDMGQDGVEPPTTGPVDVESTVRLIAPQISANFGTANGWSYLSAGLGNADVLVKASGDRRQESGTLRSINFGGGARWFLSSHVAVGFDIRFHRVAAGESTPSATLVSASVGFSVR